VFLWGCFIADPLFASPGVPFRLSLFLGDVVSTQLLGWFFVPWAFRRFSWRTAPGRSTRVTVAGYAIIAGCYLISMAVYAGLLALREAASCRARIRRQNASSQAAGSWS